MHAVRNEINENYIFPLGELHVIFAYLKVIGKYIENSGLDQLFVEANIYGPTTLHQILKGKHMKRAVEAYMCLYLSIFKLYIAAFVEHIPALDDTILPEAKVHSLYVSENISSKTKVEDHHQQMMQILANENYMEKVRTFENTLAGQAKFLHNFMKMYEILLQFTRASRQGVWELHLSSLHEITQYFFAHDQINYARLAPLYLTEMYNLKTFDKQTWDYLSSGHFTVNKNTNQCSFSSICVDHALEQENISLKIQGGIIGLTNNRPALNRFTLNTPELSEICKSLYKINGLDKHQSTKHYQLIGGTNKIIYKNVKKLDDTFATFDTYYNSQCLHVVTKAVIAETNANDIFYHGKEGQIIYDKFVMERIEGDKSVWSPIKLRRLKTFNANAKTLSTTVQNKVVSLKEDKSLFQRFLVVSQKRKETDLP